MKIPDLPGLRWRNVFLAVLGILVFLTIYFIPDRADAEPEVVTPRLIHEVEAEYTDEALDARVEGDVVVDIEIDADGEVASVELLEGLGYGLDEAAIEAVEQFQFRPATVDGEPTPVVIDYSIRFSLPTLPAAFEGTVVADDDDQPIAGATITLEYAGDDLDPPPTASDTTDRQGRFAFDDLPAGSYRVRLQLDDFGDIDTDIDLVEGQTSEADYTVSASDVVFQGQIREAGTRDRLAGMELTIFDAQTNEEIRSDYSERGGNFAFRGLDPGDYLLRVTGSGYTTTSFEFDVVDGQVTTGNFYVRADDYGGLTVRTTEERPRSEVDRQTIGLEEVRRVPGAGTDVVRVVENLPGVARTPFGGQPIIRGAAPQDTQIFLENDPIPNAFHFLAGPAVIATEMIDSVDFYPGNYSAAFGRATAGIVELQTRSPRNDRFAGYTEIDLLDASAIIEGPITDNLSFALAGRRSYYDLFLPSLLERAGSDTFVSPRYYDYQSWTTYRSDGGNHKLELFVYGSNDTLDIQFADGEPEGDTRVQTTGANFDTYFDRAQFNWEWTPENLPLDTDFMASYGRNQFGFEVADNLFFDLGFIQTQFRYDTRLDVADNLEIRSGMDIQLSSGTAEIAAPPIDGEPDASAGGPPFPLPEEGVESISDETLYYPAAYAEVDYTLADRLTLTPGFRLDYYGEIERWAPAPRFSSRLDITDDWTAKGGIGRFTQPPVPGQTDAILGNPDITFESATHYALGAEWTPRDHLEVDTTFFLRRNTDLVEPSSDQQLDDDGQRQAQSFTNDGRGRAYGWEILLRHYPRNDFFGWISYTLSRSERLDLDDNEWILFDTDQTHILTLVGGYSLPRNVDVSARFRLVSGNPDTPIVGATFDADQDAYRPRRGPTNSTRNATFNQLDIRFDRRFVFDTWQMSAYLDITNIYNATNPEGTQYNYDFSDSAPLRGLPFLPTLGVSARF